MCTCARVHARACMCILSPRAPCGMHAPQFVERGMVAANYYDLPEHMKRANKMSEARRKAKEKDEKAANECPLCGKDVRWRRRLPSAPVTRACACVHPPMCMACAWHACAGALLLRLPHARQGLRAATAAGDCTRLIASLISSLIAPLIVPLIAVAAGVEGFEARLRGQLRQVLARRASRSSRRRAATPSHHPLHPPPSYHPLQVLARRAREAQDGAAVAAAPVRGPPRPEVRTRRHAARPRGRPDEDALRVRAIRMPSACNRHDARPRGRPDEKMLSLRTASEAVAPTERGSGQCTIASAAPRASMRSDAVGGAHEMCRFRV